MGTYIKLIDFDSADEKREAFFSTKQQFVISENAFERIPGKQFAYWISDNFLKVFEINETVGDVSISDGQTKTGNNDKYLRMLWEVKKDDVGEGKKWVIHAKGGGFRRWSGNIDVVIDWSPEARSHYKVDHVARIAPEYIWYKQGICWTLISGSGKYGFRLLEKGTTFNLAAPSIFIEDEQLLFYVLGFLNTPIVENIIHLINPTINTNISDITIQPLIRSDEEGMKTIEGLVKNNVKLSGEDWDSFETSWGFKKHPLI